MLRQTGFSTPEEMQAAMDEYGAFCESLPDDADIPTFMEYLGRRSPASDLTRQIRSEVEGREFGSFQELQEHLGERMASINDGPKEDFEGLSPARMHEILHARETKRVPLLRFNAALAAADAESSPLVETIRWVLRYHADHGGAIRLTDRDNYPRALCRAYMARFIPSYREGMPVSNEESLTLLVRGHDIIFQNDWTEESRNRSELTTEGVQMLSTKGAVTIFQRAVEFLLLREDWTDSLPDSYEGALTHLALIQNAAIFSLYLLSRHPTGTIGELFNRFTRAFPDFIKPAQGDRRTIDWLGDFFATFFVNDFCVPLGLVTVISADRYRTTDLFTNALSFEV